MTVQTYSSDDARAKLRDILDIVGRGGAAIIERYRRPEAAVISVERYKRLLELERIAEARRQFAEMDAGSYVSLEDLDKELAAIDARRVKP
jgi:prevent-host-death family protein